MTEVDKGTFKSKNIGPEAKAKLKDTVLIDGQYLGSSTFDYMFGQYDNELYHLLFDGHSLDLYETTGQRPSIILGRRGSGKSTYLNHLAQKESVEAIPVKIWDLIGEVECQVADILEKQGSVDSEKVAEIWHLLFLILACVKITTLNISNPTVVRFLKGFPVGSFLESSFAEITSIALTKIQAAYKTTPGNFNTQICLKAINSSSTTLDDLEEAVSAAFLANNKTAIFMLDNPEKFTREEVNTLSLKSQDSPRQKTISGLLNLSGRFNKGNIGLQLRLCIPSEQFYYLRKASSNPRKDFNSTQVLHWTSGEILSALAHRYIVFLSVYPEFRSDDNFHDLLKIPIYKRHGAIEFWSKIFVGKVTNNRNVSEEPLVYLLRHSQLVPRQLLDYINETINLSLKGGKKDLTRLDPAYLKKAITHVEYEIASAVINAYTYSYPEGDDIFERVLPKLPILTNAQDLKAVLYKTTDAKGILGAYSQHPQVVQTKDRFLRLLVETGIYGKLSHQPKERSTGYVEAEFEYTLNRTLGIDDDDQLAMHPLFSGGIGEKHYSMLNNKTLGVYPVGTDPDVI